MTGRAPLCANQRDKVTAIAILVYFLHLNVRQIEQ